MRVRLLFEPRDLWVGVYVSKREPTIPWARRVYVLPVPMFGLMFEFFPAVRP